MELMDCDPEDFKDAMDDLLSQKVQEEPSSEESQWLDMDEDTSLFQDVCVLALGKRSGTVFQVDISTPPHKFPFCLAQELAEVLWVRNALSYWVEVS